MTTAVAAPVVATDKIACMICGAHTHSIALHLKNDHADAGMTIADYEAAYPGAPVMSAVAEKALTERRAAAAKVAAAATVITDYKTGADSKQAFHEVYNLGTSKAVMSTGSGKPIPINVLGASSFSDLVPSIDPNYVFNVVVLKTLQMGIELRIPVYLWGHAGTGKTTIFEQIAARTNRPLFRVQHTANTEEEHILGGWRLRSGETIFELGPLAMAMKHGWIYMADEYDFGRPEVLSVYQAVLEGKPLVIKEADPANRVIHPHPNFRFIATGNTNGSGDESGLYTGTNVQNAANYERFGIVEQMPYMEAPLEARLVSQQAQIPLEDAKKLVDFAARIRTEFEGSKISNPISPRSLIFAGVIGVGCQSYRIGLEKSFINRLSSVDRETAKQVAQRVFGA